MESRPWFHQAVGDGDLLLPVWLELIGSNAELDLLPTHSTPHSEKTVQDEVIASHITSIVSVWSWALHRGLEQIKVVPGGLVGNPLSYSSLGGSGVK